MFPMFAIYASCKPDGKVYKMQLLYVFSQTDSFTEPNKCDDHILQELLTLLLVKTANDSFDIARLKLMRASCTLQHLR